MAFGQKGKHPEPINEETCFEHEGNIDCVEGIEILDGSHPDPATPPKQQTAQSNSHSKPLYNEVSLCLQEGERNPGGSKVWVCKHCKNIFTGSRTRIHAHFFGPALGKKYEIRRCDLVSNRSEFIALRRRVEEARKMGISSSLKTSTITKKQSASLAAMKPIQASFNMIEREMVDMKIMQGLCANGISFNVLRNL